MTEKAHLYHNPPGLVSPPQKLEPPHREDSNTAHHTNRLIPPGSLHF